MSSVTEHWRERALAAEKLIAQIARVLGHGHAEAHTIEVSLTDAESEMLWEILAGATVKVQLKESL